MVLKIGPHGEPKYRESGGMAIPSGIMGFSDVQVTDKYIYAAFQGRSFKDIAQQQQPAIDGGQFIYVFSLKGLPLYKYTLNHFIYGINAVDGSLRWKVETNKAVLGSAAIHKGKAYIGGSDGIFRCIRVRDGKLLWTFDGVAGYVSTLPTLAKGKVIFGSWGNGFYALNQHDGALEWQWDNGHKNRMFSAAACYPVVYGDRVFIVAPDRYMTAIDLKTGATIWRENHKEHRVRESIGYANELVLAKTMDGEVVGVSVFSDHFDVSWKADLKLPYELAPTAIYSNKKLAFIPSDKGLLNAVDLETGKTVWQYKISNAMINPPLVLKDRIVVSTMDGKITMLTY